MRIGIFGGTFSPPHIGHLRSAKVFIKELSLDKLLIIPAKVSPFKTDAAATADDDDRFTMARLCFEGLSSEKCKVEICDIEIKEDKTSYTIETINKLKVIYPESELFLFVGSDMFYSLERWRDFENIFSSCTIYTRVRQQNEKDEMIKTFEKYQSKYGANIFLSADKELVASSTDVRAALSKKDEHTFRNLLTDKVFRYIIERRLYID